MLVHAKRASRFFSLGLLFVLTLALSAADARAADQQGNFYEESTFVNGCVGDICELYFTAIPTGKMVLFHQINCSISTNSTGVLEIRFGVRRSNGTIPNKSVALKPEYISTRNGINYYYANVETTFLIGQNNEPRVAVVVIPANNTSINCSIFGKILPRTGTDVL